ncbi:MAG: ATP-binding protein, partial [Actinomycetota bacterium]|nr:ATP-binding protein [Actinomycetota bacterium]
MADAQRSEAEHADIVAEYERHRDFVSILAHELKGPMTTIMGFGRTLEEHWDTIDEGRRVQFISIVRRETERLAQLVSDLLDMSGVESGGFRYEMAPMAIGELVESIVSIHGSLFAAHRVKSEIPDDLPLVMGDKERIRQVLLNLMSNAARYSPEGTTITVSAQVVEEDGRPRAKVSVSDEGIGIAPEDHERIFSKFATLPKPGWTQKGTGLGLFITKGIVDAHGGH